MKFKNYDLAWTSNNLSASRTTDYENLDQDAGFSLQVVFSGTALNGSFKLQASNDSTNWTDLPSSSQAISALTGASSVIWNIDAAYYNYVRAAWTFTSGAGTISVSKLTVKAG